MERIVYDRMAELDTRHWWYRARRDVLASLIERRIAPPAGGRILEVGCGTGHNLPMLSGFGTVDAVELDPVAREKATQRLGKPVMESRLEPMIWSPRSTWWSMWKMMSRRSPRSPAA
jgi:protein-L-isoaspartate O-methyltransferase